MRRRHDLLHSDLSSALERGDCNTLGKAKLPGNEKKTVQLAHKLNTNSAQTQHKLNSQFLQTTVASFSVQFEEHTPLQSPPARLT